MRFGSVSDGVERYKEAIRVTKAGVLNKLRASAYLARALSDIDADAADCSAKCLLLSSTSLTNTVQELLISEKYWTMPMKLHQVQYREATSQPLLSRI